MAPERFSSDSNRLKPTRVSPIIPASDDAYVTEF